MITPTETATPTPQAQPTAAASKNTAAATAASDFQSFLSLLTAQLRHQDPLSPLDSTQFVEQLASFSSVEQQIETNRLLKEFTGGAGDAGLEAAATWIGKEVDAPSGSIAFDGSPVGLSLPAGAAEGGNIVIRNSDGDVVYSEPAAQGETGFTWNGVDDFGAMAPAGDYKIALETKNEEGGAVTTPLSTAARVTEARIVDGALKLVLANGAVVDPSAITAIREPSS